MDVAHRISTSPGLITDKFLGFWVIPFIYYIVYAYSINVQSIYTHINKNIYIYIYIQEYKTYILVQRAPPASAMKYLQPMGIKSPVSVYSARALPVSIMQAVPDLGLMLYIDIAAFNQERRKDYEGVVRAAINT